VDGQFWAQRAQGKQAQENNARRTTAPLTMEEWKAMTQIGWTQKAPSDSMISKLWQEKFNV
jgi:hypothetical protein